MYKYETHLHTREGSLCAMNSGAEMAVACKKAGYDGMIVTNHFWGGNTAIDSRLPWRQWVARYMRGYDEAKAIGDKIGLRVFFGWESGFQGTEFLVYGLNREWLMAHPEISHVTVEQQYKLVHESGGFVVHAHPFREAPSIPSIRLYPEYVDAVEAINATHTEARRRDPAWNRSAVAYARKHGLPMTAGSDIHNTALSGGGILTNRPLQRIEDYINLLKSDEPFDLTDGQTVYNRFGEPKE